MRRNGRGSAVAGIVARGVGGNGGVGRIGVLSVAGGSQRPLDFLHVGQPDVLSGFTSLDGGCNEGNDVYKNYEGSSSA